MFVERMLRWGALSCALILSACSQESATVAGDQGAAIEPAATLSTNEPVLPADSEATSESVRIFVDPATGEIREPTAAEEAAAPSRSEASAPASKPREAPHIREIHLPDGSIAVIPEKKDREYLQACVSADDKVALDHGCR